MAEKKTVAAETVEIEKKSGTTKEIGIIEISRVVTGVRLVVKMDTKLASALLQMWAVPSVIGVNSGRDAVTNAADRFVDGDYLSINPLLVAAQQIRDNAEGYKFTKTYNAVCGKAVAARWTERMKGIMSNIYLEFCQPFCVGVQLVAQKVETL